MYWVAISFRKGEVSYLVDWDKVGNPVHSKEISDAHRFYDFNSAMQWFNRGYCIEKRY